jgi:hypothetical protein
MGLWVCGSLLAVSRLQLSMLVALVIGRSLVC